MRVDETKPRNGKQDDVRVLTLRNIQHLSATTFAKRLRSADAVHLTHLMFEFCRLGPEHMFALRHHLRRATHLRSVSVFGTRFLDFQVLSDFFRLLLWRRVLFVDFDLAGQCSDQFILHFLELASLSRTILRLSLSGARTESHDTEVALSTHPTLTDLDFRACIGLDFGVFCHHLQRNTRLRRLRISHNFFGDQAMRHLADMIYENTTLETLHLHNCFIHNAHGTVVLASALRANRTLRTLIYSTMTMNEIGARAFGHMLAVNKGLTYLDVSRNFVGDAIDIIARGLAQNSTLLYLDLSGCGMDNWTSLRHAMRKNQTLLQLRFYGNESNESCAALCDDVRERVHSRCFVWRSDLHKHTHWVFKQEVRGSQFLFARLPLDCVHHIFLWLWEFHKACLGLRC